MELHVYGCINCGTKVQSSHDLNINERLVCVQCNAEMEPEAGLLDPKTIEALGEFVREMTEKVIPEIIKFRENNHF